MFRFTRGPSGRIRPHHWPHWLGALLLLSPWGLIGCQQSEGDGLPREPISGAVTWKGKPLSKGTIQLIPTSQAEVPPIVAAIEEGRFTVPKEQGPIPGNYTIVITESTGVAPSPDQMPGESTPPPPQTIPAQYNTKTKLKFEVKAGEANKLDLALTP